MSTKAKAHKSIGLLTIFATFLLSDAIYGQTKVVLSVEPKEIKVTIERQFDKDTEIGLIDSYADASRLSFRLRGISAKTKDDKSPGFKRLGPVNFALLDRADVVNYVIDANPPSKTIASPHVSWVEEEYGLLNLADILPESFDESLRLTINHPKEWKVATREDRVSANVFDVPNPGDAVFLVGKNVRQRATKNAEIAMVGEWQFTDQQAVEMTEDILEHYRSVFRQSVNGKKQIIIIPFPKQMSSGRWRAETRGRTVTIASTLSAYKNIGVQRLHEQLRHELFHLWLPNDLDITGDYAWLYEGFARYESLKAALKLRQIRFEDYLATLSEAQQIAARSRSDLTLWELSEKQWLVGPGVLGARATLFAFYVDMKIIEGGKRLGSSLLMRRFYREFKKKEGAALASEIGDFFRKQRSVTNVYDKYVLGRLKLPISDVIEQFGLRARSRGGRTYFELSPDRNRRERAMLRKLGYNGV